ncbi:meiosis-specific with OB domain-containing protein-like [Ornithodoros turicata]|uniref:meiosis-specific with OB domain-containing protein-like n=1 Tax=Ornithodoros turicata TaxID=34597 RepID=UPI003139399E
MASWKKGREGKAGVLERENVENRVYIAKMSQNLQKATVYGVVIAKQSPRTVSPSAQTGEERCVLNFTMRDSEVDTINVACWGDSAEVRAIGSLFRIGDCIQITNVLVKPRNIGTASDSFAPRVSSQYQLVANIGKDQCELKMLEESLFCQFMPLLQVPSGSAGDVTQIADILYCGRGMADQHVTMLVGVKGVGPPTPVSTKDGRQAQKVEVSVLDQSHHDFKVLLWDEELIHLSQFWKEKETVLFIADVRVRFNQFFGMTASASGKTVVTTNPNIPEAGALFEYLQSVDLTGTELGGTMLDTTVYTAKQIGDEVATRFQTGSATPFSGILFAILSQLDLDGPGVRLTTFRCGHCNFRVKPETGCTNEGCPTTRGEAEPEVTEEYDIPVVWTDHTGSILRSRITGLVATGLFGVKVEEFVKMSEKELTSLKWKFLLERFKMQFKVSLRTGAKGSEPVLRVISCEPADPREYLEKVFHYY